MVCEQTNSLELVRTNPHSLTTLGNRTMLAQLSNRPQLLADLTEEAQITVLAPKKYVFPTIGVFRFCLLHYT